MSKFEVEEYLGEYLVIRREGGGQFDDFRIDERCGDETDVEFAARVLDAVNTILGWDVR